MSFDHSFTELNDGSQYAMTDGYAEDSTKPVGNGTATCAHCGLVLPAQDGQVLPDWLQYIKGINCADLLVKSVHER